MTPHSEPIYQLNPAPCPGLHLVPPLAIELEEESKETRKIEGGRK